MMLILLNESILKIHTNNFRRLGNRKFLRLGNPLNCHREVFQTMLEQISAASNPVPLSRVKTLVSMTTPRVDKSFVKWDWGQLHNSNVQHLVLRGQVQ